MEIEINRVGAEDNGIQDIAKADFERLQKREALSDAQKQLAEAQVDQKLQKLGVQIDQAPTDQKQPPPQTCEGDGTSKGEQAEIETIGVFEIPEVLYFEVLEGLGYDPKYVDRDSADIEKYTAMALKKHSLDKITTDPDAAAIAAWLKPAGRTAIERIKRSKLVADIRANMQKAAQKLSGKPAQDDKPSYPRPDLGPQGNTRQ